MKITIIPKLPLSKQKLTLQEINEVITPKLREEAIKHLKTILPEEQITETVIVDHMRNRLQLYIKDRK